MNKYWSRRLENVEPYVPGEQPKDRTFIKLNTNESPYPPSAAALEAAREAVDDRLRLYPDPTGERLKTAIAEYYGTDKRRVFVGNGSDEVLAMCFLAFTDKGGQAAFPDVTYSFYPVYAEFFGVNPKIIPLRDDFSLRVEDYFDVGCPVIIANPNAPTSLALPVEDIGRLAEHNRDELLIVDEAYVDFGAESAVKLTERCPNVLVVQTFSKSRSLAGLRVGFAIGDKNLIDALEAVKNSFNSYTLDRVALAAAEKAIEDRVWFEECRAKIIAVRDDTAAKMRDMGFKVADSRSNFLFAEHPDIPAPELFSKLREKGILVRYFNLPRVNNGLRISVGTREEMYELRRALEDIIG